MSHLLTLFAAIDVTTIRNITTCIIHYTQCRYHVVTILYAVFARGRTDKNRKQKTDRKSRFIMVTRWPRGPSSCSSGEGNLKQTNQSRD